MEYFSEQVIKFIAAIPAGKVVAYGQVAAACGKPRAARQVARILKNYSVQLQLPWQRVINSRGQISLGKNGGYEEQKARLLSEGIIFDENDSVDWEKFGWRPDL